MMWKTILCSVYLFIMTFHPVWASSENDLEKIFWFEEKNVEECYNEVVVFM